MTKKLDITLETKELAHALSFASSVVEKRSTASELSNIKLLVKENLLEIVATDMDLYLSQTIGASVRGEGVITVSTQMLSEIIRKIPDKEVILKQSEEGEQLEIIGTKCHFSVLTLSAEQFPQMDEIKADSVLKTLSRDLARIIDYTSFSMSSEETRYNLNGLYIHVKDNILYSASTDGHRLSLAGVNLGEEAKNFGIILPRKAVQEILKIVKDPKNIQSNIEIQLSHNKIKFVCNNLVMISKLIDGTFPDYSAFIPQNNTNKLTVKTKLLASAIDRVAIVTIDKFRAVKFILSSESIEITASGEAKGVAREKLVCSSDQDNLCDYTGDEIIIGFNPKYLSDALSAIKQEQVEIYLGDSHLPTLIKVENNLLDSFVIMPVKV